MNAETLYVILVIGLIIGAYILKHTLMKGIYHLEDSYKNKRNQAKQRGSG
ncbi:hypothetical protein ACTGJ2_05730 [Streptococcus suis]|uniref:Uncharacterized protein n=1 Tax=Streptococcus suis TaxID=1307 RepID=A0A0Z8M2F2_STRSU|nr:hypothetical protein [Streptococcus suis]MCL4923582.1 hypothetical protein [Streptococcus suis]MDW8714262.1 hypothetical protein [Streptococcus suis]CYU96280.1 Uncharacterised protein [Streptococcus suis]CYV86241.1 Uncharacterised protein [Streptococcus suis]CYW01139.1 Uncharacterised protein [Streptococcus suis]